MKKIFVCIALNLILIPCIYAEKKQAPQEAGLKKVFEDIDTKVMILEKSAAIEKEKGKERIFLKKNLDFILLFAPHLLTDAGDLSCYAFYGDFKRSYTKEDFQIWEICLKGGTKPAYRSDTEKSYLKKIGAFFK